MPNRYHLYEKSSGKLLSSASQPPKEIQDGRAMVESDKVGIWNPTTLDFDPFPPRQILTKQQFLSLLTSAEKLKILKAARTDSDLQDFIDLLNLEGQFNRKSQTAIAGLKLIESKGIFETPNRIGEILNA